MNGTKFFYEKPVDVLEIATKGIVNTIDSCLKNKIKEIFIASSSEVYQTLKTAQEMLKIPGSFAYIRQRACFTSFKNYGKKYFSCWRFR